MCRGAVRDGWMDVRARRNGGARKNGGVKGKEGEVQGKEGEVQGKEGEVQGKLERCRERWGGSGARKGKGGGCRLNNPGI